MSLLTAPDLGTETRTVEISTTMKSHSLGEGAVFLPHPLAAPARDNVRTASRRCVLPDFLFAFRLPKAELGLCEVYF